MSELFRTQGERDPRTRRPIYDEATAEQIAKPTSDQPLTAAGERGGPTLDDHDGDQAAAAAAAFDPGAAATGAPAGAEAAEDAEGPSASITARDGEVVIDYWNPTDGDVVFWRSIGGRDGERTIAAGDAAEGVYKREPGEPVAVRLGGPDGDLLATEG